MKRCKEEMKIISDMVGMEAQEMYVSVIGIDGYRLK